jgi:hypothetical protein
LSKDSLNIVYWITLASNVSNNAQFVDYFGFTSSFNPKTLFFKKNAGFNDVYLLKSVVDNDQNFLSDLTYLLMFY